MLKEPDLSFYPYDRLAKEPKKYSLARQVTKDYRMLKRKLKGIAHVIIRQGKEIEVGKDVTEYFAWEFLEDGQPITAKILNRELKDYEEDEDGGLTLKID